MVVARVALAAYRAYRAAQTAKRVYQGYKTYKRTRTAVKVYKRSQRAKVAAKAQRKKTIVKYAGRGSRQPGTRYLLISRFNPWRPLKPGEFASGFKGKGTFMHRIDNIVGRVKGAQFKVDRFLSKTYTGRLVMKIRDVSTSKFYPRLLNRLMINHKWSYRKAKRFCDFIAAVNGVLTVLRVIKRISEAEDKYEVMQTIVSEIFGPFMREILYAGTADAYNVYPKETTYALWLVSQFATMDNMQIQEVN